MVLLFPPSFHQIPSNDILYCQITGKKKRGKEEEETKTKTAGSFEQSKAVHTLHIYTYISGSGEKNHPLCHEFLSRDSNGICLFPSSYNKTPLNPRFFLLQCCCISKKASCSSSPSSSSSCGKAICMPEGFHHHSPPPILCRRWKLFFFRKRGRDQHS